MAGGTWTSQTKLRPGAYINFKAVKKGSMTTGDRGVVAMGLPLSWGKEDELIEVLSTDLLDGNSNKLVGFDAYDSASKLLAGALKYCYKALVYRLPTVGASAVTGVKATATIGRLVCTAKYKGADGDKISMIITKDANNIYTVTTYYDGDVVDVQKVTEIAGLVNNDFVDFSDAGSGSFITTTGTTLDGGVDTVVTSASYTNMNNALKIGGWQTLAFFSSDSTDISNEISFVENLRNDEGKYVQIVVANYASANSEGVINNVCGAIINEVTFSAVDFCAIVAGMTAGANFNQSNTARMIDGATSIVGALSDSDIKTGLANGKFIISSSASGKIKVEQDINSLHDYPSDRDYSFSKNRVVRTLDEIGNTVKQTWEDNYMGKVDNNDIGRGLFQSDLIVYGRELERLGGIQNFKGAEDIEVVQGTNIDSVVVTWAIQPVDSMEKLYMTVNVSS